MEVKYLGFVFEYLSFGDVIKKFDLNCEELIFVLLFIVLMWVFEFFLEDYIGYLEVDGIKINYKVFVVLFV